MRSNLHFLAIASISQLVVNRLLDFSRIVFRLAGFDLVGCALFDRTDNRRWNEIVGRNRFCGLHLVSALMRPFHNVPPETSWDL